MLMFLWSRTRRCLITHQLQLKVRLHRSHSPDRVKHKDLRDQTPEEENIQRLSLIVMFVERVVVIITTSCVTRHHQARGERVLVAIVNWVNSTSMWPICSRLVHPFLLYWRTEKPVNKMTSQVSSYGSLKNSGFTYISVLSYTVP